MSHKDTLAVHIQLKNKGKDERGVDQLVVPGGLDS